MQFLVTGATGFIGRHVTRALLERGNAVRALVRRGATASRLPDGAEPHFGDLAEPASLSGAARGVEVAIHLGAAMSGDWETHRRATVDGTRHLLAQCVAEGVPRFVHVSSILVYDRSRLSPGQTLREASALAEPGPDIGPLASAKVEAERLVEHAARDAQIQGLVLRPGIVVGAQRLRFPELGMPLLGRRVAVGSPAQPLPLVAMESLVEALLAVLESPPAPLRVYNVVDDFRASRADYLQILGGLGGERCPVLHVPLHAALVLARALEVLRGAPGLGWLPQTTPAKLRGRALAVHYSTAALQEATGWRPASDLRETLSRLLAAP